MATTDKYEVHEHDVLVIGAGGAGLRAAIEASAAGLKTALICKSLLGKAHTVMAEGGIAAAMANVDPQDGWETHFKDTMRGGVYLNHYRMAQLHAQQAPDRIRELADDEILQMARLLVSKPDREIFGDTEFELRDIVLKVGAKAIEEHLRQKKTATKDAV